MKKLSIAACALAIAAGLGSAHAAEVSITGNGGAVTPYIFHGMPQTDRQAKAEGGFDLDVSGFHLGAWIWQVDTAARTAGDAPATAVEYDIHGGYAFDVSNLSFGIGATGYLYTDDFDEDLAFKVNSNGNPTEDTFFYAGIVKTFDPFRN